MTWWLWLLIGFGLIAFEMFLPAGFALLIIGLSFVITGITTGLGVDDPVWLEWLICFVSIIVLFKLARKPLMKLFGLDAPSNYNEMTGQEVLLTSSIAPGATGNGEMQGTQWKVRNTGDQPLHSGERLKVLKMEGLTIEVKK